MIGRRQFLQSVTVGTGVSMLASCGGLLAAERGPLVSADTSLPISNGQERNWLGHDFWGNRLQDWRVKDGWIECVNERKNFEVRTVSLLSRTLVDSHSSGRVKARFKLKNKGNGSGFCGFLLGVGQGKLDWRASCFAQRAGGTGGGFLAVMDVNGQLGFQDFSNAEKPMSFEKFGVLGNADEAVVHDFENKEFILDCHIDAVENGLFDVRLIALDAETGAELGFVVRTGVPAEDLRGGIMMVSSPEARKSGTRWAFKDVSTGGSKISTNPAHTLGEVMGCMHTLNKDVLRISAQFMPINLSEQPNARFDYKVEGSQKWIEGPVEKIGDGFVSFFRLSSWDASKTFDYRIVFPGSDKQLFDGQIVKDPGTSRALKIALFSCTLPCNKHIDRENYQPNYHKEQLIGRYTPENINFPHNEIVKSSGAHDPDLYIFCGDQYYENYPTSDKNPDSELKLDTLYRWYLWYWGFRDAIKSRPTIMLVDDHDILQGNLWGNDGDSSGGPKEEDGGYKHDLDTVRMVYRCQHIHNPDPYDPTPIVHDIPVAYANFVYGGTSFAIVEDRKFKMPPKPDEDPLKVKGALLGERQEKFLKEWKDIDSDLPKVVITASIWGSPQTSPEGDLTPLIDYDANGYPFDGRTRAVKLVADAQAVVLAGDQHLGMIAHQGVTDYDDGAVFFSGPATAAFWQRWFEGFGKLDNQRNGDPNTGNFVDFCGNKMRVLAVANPKLPYDEFFENKSNWGNFIADRSLKSEGYGLIRVDHSSQEFVMECWEWNSDPQTDKQFAGWPYMHPFPTKN